MAGYDGGGGGGSGEDGGYDDGSVGGSDGGAGEDGGAGAGGEDGGGGTVAASCGFTYQAQFAAYKSAAPKTEEELAWEENPEPEYAEGEGGILYPEPPPLGVYQKRIGSLPELQRYITMPSYTDNMPKFDRANPFNGAERCYELPVGPVMLSESEAYDLYVGIAEHTTWLQVDKTPGKRTVVGIRGAYPGTFEWNGNEADRFNDTLVLLWKESNGTKRVLEFPGHTDVGHHYFGVESSSFLRANRRYKHQNGTHKTYNALTITYSGYQTRDDTNHNGHWDDDRNGWLPDTSARDYFRTGSGHNIHLASVNGPLGSARVDSWSAGCQVIPGRANWDEFIYNAWTNTGDIVYYFLVDARDIPTSYWYPCTPDGSHDCPYQITQFPYTHSSSTVGGEELFDRYNCATQNESGPEKLYVFSVDQAGTLTVKVECTSPVDADIHLLDADDPNACYTRNDKTFTYSLVPGRWWIAVDSFVNSSNHIGSGAYTLTVDFR